MKKKIVRNVVLGSATLLGVGYIIKKVTMKVHRINCWQEAINVGKVVIDSIDNNQVNVGNDNPIYYQLGMAVEEKDKVKVKRITELAESKKKVV